MIKDLSASDIQLVLKLLHRYMFQGAIDYFDEKIMSIAQRNQEARKSPLLTFTFGGEVFRFESQPVRFPQTLAKFLYPEMHELMAKRRKILDEEGAYVKAALSAALSRCESATHLYQLLPTLLHEQMRKIGIKEELDLDNFQPLSDEQVAEFKTKHAHNLDMLFQRATKNTLGVFV